ncbi:hypothetical protein BSP75_17765 [Aeromonas sp. YN13HZO-058]|nr:hypothetical protein BSP75_17765 [Aeromonas sp. YN13HZO-058]
MQDGAGLGHQGQAKEKQSIRERACSECRKERVITAGWQARFIVAKNDQGVGIVMMPTPWEGANKSLM